MKQSDTTNESDPVGMISRRMLLKSAAALAITPMTSFLAQAGAHGSVLAYVGSYTGTDRVYIYSAWTWRREI